MVIILLIILAWLWIELNTSSSSGGSSHHTAHHTGDHKSKREPNHKPSHKPSHTPSHKPNPKPNPKPNIEHYTYGQRSADEALERRADKVKAKPASSFRDDHSHTLDHVKTTLYYVQLQRQGRSYYKIGITAKRRVLDRFHEEIEAGVKVKALKTWRYASRGEALKKEKYILTLFDTYRITRGGPLSYGGNTEVFREDIFDLQSRVDDRYIKSKIDRAQRYLCSDAL